MKQFNLILALFAISLLSSCELIGDIFKAGAYVGIIAVLIIFGVIFWLISKFKGKD